MFNKLVDPSALPTHSKALHIVSPLSGSVVALDLVNNALFNARLMGEGVAIKPSGFQVYAPFAGTIVHFPTLANQIRIKANNGLLLQIQLGMDAFTMMAEGFKPKVKVGDKVEQGQILLEFSLSKMKQSLNQILCPITLINSDKIIGLQAYYMQVRATEDRIFTLYL